MTDRTLRVLIVDGDRSTAKTLVDRLEAKGFETEMAYSAFEALEKIAEAAFDKRLNNPFNCVLSDINLPEGDGMELCRAIMAIQPGLPVVLMTASSNDHLIEIGIEEGAVAVLAKPLDVEKFVQLLIGITRQERGRVMN